MSDSNAYLKSISSDSPLNKPTSIPHSSVPKLPDYLANTKFAEMYYKAHEILRSVTLPTEWNVDDKCTHLNVDSDRLKVNYIGPGVNDFDAAAIRANHSMPPRYDGLTFFSGFSKPYGPKFTTGDTIGCCLNLRDGTAFYTKNGQHLGIAFRDLKGVFYPSIGLRTRGESIEANFGHKKFKFAIEHYM
ncbi:5277_t:CDS:2 [Diversispora eburnea]|uniref:5277_t:CDS:1 n=1 Tax=Diversispora eburnea TaxID=1213867 RepID=A0A9N8YKA8_9GLOM|nr:5277_t:CDS:2 [Diversispora eburnea]